jgi:hypothetical protein
MSFKHTIDIFLTELSNLGDLVSEFKNYSSIPKIEIDIALSKIRNLYEILMLIDEEEIIDTYNKKIITNKTQSDDNSKVSGDIAEADQDIFDAFEQEIIEEKETIRPEKILNKEEVANELDGKPVKTKHTKTAEKEILADKIAHRVTTRYETLAEKVAHENLSEKFQKKGLKDLKKAITITEKFLFTKELFNGDAGIYNETIEYINKAKSLKEAEEYLRKHFSWDIRNKAALDFMQLVERKFSAE